MNDAIVVILVFLFLLLISGILPADRTEYRREGRLRIRYGKIYPGWLFSLVEYLIKKWR